MTLIVAIIYNKPTRCNSGSIVFINNYKFALHVSDALASIIRSTINCNSSHWCLSWVGME
jgi:hypothetical protein